jgi:hypothetical protein
MILRFSFPACARVSNGTGLRKTARVAFNIAPTIGEYFVFPALTTTGPCEIGVFEGIPGGPMDCWKLFSGRPSDS